MNDNDSSVNIINVKQIFLNLFKYFKIRYFKYAKKKDIINWLLRNRTLCFEDIWINIINKLK